MSSSVISAQGQAAQLRPPALAGSFQGGVGMLEFMLALMIFSTGVMGLLSVQLAGMKASHEAGQRSVATALARDILERIQANPFNAPAYAVQALGAAARPLSAPGADCDTVGCSPAQLAAFDLWQWESLLLGAAARHHGSGAGGLRRPLACITHQVGVVDVVISWQGGSSAMPSSASSCSIAGPGPHEGAGDMEHEDNLVRHQLRLSTYVAGE